MMIHAHLFWSIRRNRVVVAVLCLTGLLFLAGMHLFMRDMVTGGVIEARPQDVAKLATRSLLPIYALMTMVGLHVVASDRRSGTLGWRVTLLGRPDPVLRAVWGFGALLSAVTAAALTGIAAFFEQAVWKAGGPVDVPRLALDAVLLCGALLTFFAWGVLVASLVSETWAQITFGFMIPWIALPIARATMVASAPGTWLAIRRFVPFEAALSLSSWAGQRNPLIDDDGSIPYPQLASCVFLAGLAAVVCRRRLRGGSIDA
jgi:hypothetical protein